MLVRLPVTIKPVLGGAVAGATVTVSSKFPAGSTDAGDAVPLGQRQRGSGMERGRSERFETRRSRTCVGRRTDLLLERDEAAVRIADLLLSELDEDARIRVIAARVRAGWGAG